MPQFKGITSVNEKDVFHQHIFKSEISILEIGEKTVEAF